MVLGLSSSVTWNAEVYSSGLSLRGSVTPEQEEKDAGPVFFETDSTPSSSLTFSHLDSRKGKGKFYHLETEGTRKCWRNMHCGRVRGGDWLTFLDSFAT